MNCHYLSQAAVLCTHPKKRVSVTTCPSQPWHISYKNKLIMMDAQPDTEKCRRPVPVLLFLAFAFARTRGRGNNNGTPRMVQGLNMTFDITMSAPFSQSSAHLHQDCLRPSTTERFLVGIMPSLVRNNPWDIGEP
ncbi:hypothetical protein NXS19_012268 [Fusarium pseudograminearum]|nr:hypothetical protein NXS19_012268 [Fusarium pseudograminearum]